MISTQSVSEKGKQGRHTTTTSALYEWEKDSCITDTPGIRSLDFLEFSAEELLSYFPDFLPFASLCRYRDCLHLHEPECRVQQAVES